MIDKILHLHGVAAYAIIFAVPALEASAFLGFFFPGEIAVLLGGVLAFQGGITLGGAIGAAVAGAIIGDSIGYEVGKRFGTRLLEGPLRRFVKPEHQARAMAFLRRHGGKAVFLGRFAAALRVLVPGFAGIANIPYPTFFFYNATGGALWATGFTLLGYAAGSEYRRVEHVVGRASQIVLGLFVAVVLVMLAARWVSRHPQRISAWWVRVRNRPLARRFGRQLDFLAARFRMGEVLGLGFTLGLIVVGAIGVAFGTILHDVVSRQNLIRVDQPILNVLARHTEGGVTATMRAVSFLGSTPFVLGLCGFVALILIARHAWSRLVLIAVSSLGAVVLERVVKVLVARPRPPVHALVHATGFSFPSGHATLSAVAYGAIAMLIARSTSLWRIKVAVWTAAVLLAGLIGFSRMYLLVHYFTDVIGGIALGALWLAVVANGTRLWERRRALRT